VDYLSSSEKYSCPSFVTRLKETLHSVYLDFKVVVPYVRTKFYLLYRLIFLFFRTPLLFKFIFELTVIHQLAHRRISVRCDLNQVNSTLLRYAQSFFNVYDSKLFSLNTYKPDLFGCDSPVNSSFRNTGSRITSPSSYTATSIQL